MSLSESKGADTQRSLLRILLVEDVPAQRRLLERTLLNMGHVVVTATDGEQALQRMLERAFDILITDWDMPGMDGPTLCSTVRAANLEQPIYIIMLTGHDSVSDFVAGIDAGADEYVRKPAEPRELQARLNAGRRIVELERALRRAKATDSLVQTYTRAYLDEQLPREITRALRYKAPLSVVMADLDHFKSINDQLGHAGGDRALQGFCALAKASIRDSIDWIGRYGGEEFAIALPETDAQGAYAVAEKLRLQCMASPIASPAGPLVVTVSMGISQLAPSEEDAKSLANRLLAEADRALYDSKRHGRNRVTVWKSNSNG
jgi:two-component system, cell cycle response regulator